MIQCWTLSTKTKSGLRHKKGPAQVEPQLSVTYSNTIRPKIYIFCFCEKVKVPQAQSIRGEKRERKHDD